MTDIRIPEEFSWTTIVKEKDGQKLTDAIKSAFEYCQNDINIHSERHLFSMYQEHMKNAVFAISNPIVLQKVVDIIEQIPLGSDVIGDLYEYMLHKIYTLNENFNKYFRNYDFHNLYKELLNFCTVDLSAFYFDIRKDTLYCDPKNSNKRKSTLTLLNVILDTLLKWFAPILSFTTEEIYQLISKKNNSIHLQKFIQMPKNFQNLSLNKKWLELIKIRNFSNVSIEEKRSSKEIGSSLEANLKIKLNDKYRDIVKNIDFSELCITSKAEITFSKKIEIEVDTSKAKGVKCPVCWKINPNSCVRHPT